MPPPDLPVATHQEVIGIAVGGLTRGAVLPIRARRTVTDFDNVAISLLAMNTHPLHTDYAYARTTRFGKPLVVSPFLVSILVGLVTNELQGTPIDAVELTDLSFGQPVHPGDTITASAQVEEVASRRLVLAVQGVRESGEPFARFRLSLTLGDGGPAGAPC